MNDAGEILVADIGCTRVTKLTLFETKPDNSYHTLANTLHFQCLLLGVTFDSTKKLLLLFPISIRAHTKRLSRLCSKMSWGNCVAFVSLVLVAIVVRGMRVDSSHSRVP